MDKATLDKYILDLEKELNSKVLIYFTNDFPPGPFSTQIGPDTLSLFKNILEKQGDVNKRTLVLNTNGGLLNVAWPLVNLIREYTKKEFEVIIPSKALSVGTLISIGADKIKMCKGSFLSPIDPTGNFPINKGGNIQNKTCSVEDIMGYIKFAKEKIGLADQVALTETLRLITSEFSPSMIGSLNRTHSLIRSLSQKMMRTRYDKKFNDVKIEYVSRNLIEDLFSHNHLINLKEAQKIGLEFASEMGDQGKENVKSLYNYYKEKMYLEEKIQEIDNKIRGLSSTDEGLELTGACVHSLELKYNFNTKATLGKAPNQAGQLKSVIDIKEQSWVEFK